MITERDIVNQLTESVTLEVSKVIKESLSDIVEYQISKALSKALLEGHFYRSLNNEVIDSIGTIYDEIKSVKKSLAPQDSTEPVQLIIETDSILDGIVKATEKATLRILDYLEQMQGEIDEIKSLIKENSSTEAGAKLENLDKTILCVMTELSFQDLTGQQIRRVVQSLKKVEEIVFNTYVTTEILKKSKEHSPEKNIEQIREESRELIDSARNKKDLVDQDGVDALLDQFGL